MSTISNFTTVFFMHDFSSVLLVNLTIMVEAVMVSP